MGDKEQAKAKLKELVSRFSQANLNKDYINSQNEEWIKHNYIEPLLYDVLGWSRGDIEKEARILKGRADYILKIGNEEVLIIEAKKVGASLTEDVGRQAVSYAYHRKVKIAIVTNFKEIRVYHALSNIKNIDNNLLKLESNAPFRLPFDQFLDKFDILSLLSKESFENKSIGKLLPSKLERASKPIDESILDDLLQIRDWLSKDLKKIKVDLSKEHIDEIVQILIDRLIFMRSVEDRGLEPKNFLLGLIDDVRLGRTDKNMWSSLKDVFKTFDKSYNSKLFAEGLLEKEGFFDEQTLVKVVRALYFGTKELQARYMFDEIPGDLLGNIYEQYLGTILESTEKRVKLDEGSGKRKKMGIYYTPSYIVDYIVKNTVGEYIKNKTIDEILDVKIVDPACGSGSFIVRAFQEVCNSIEERLKKGEKGRMVTFQSYKERLSFSQKISILTQCIYGVDLDEKAVELAQLNLLLKLLEDETPESHKRLLPNLRDNIKCGNSLIDDSKVAGDKAFKWEAQFPEVFRDGGFDVVVGNPPYGAKLSSEDKRYLDTNVLKDKSQDTANYFIGKSFKFLKEDGQLGFIVPKGITYVPSSESTREIITNNKVERLIDVSEAFGKEVQYEQIIIISVKKSYKSDYDFICGFFADGIFKERISTSRALTNKRLLIWTDKKVFNIINKILNNSFKLSEIADSRRGLGCNKDTSTKKSDFVCLKGQNVQRYYLEGISYVSRSKVEQDYAWLLVPKIIAQEIIGRYGKPIFGNFRNVRLKAMLDLDNSLTLDTVVNIFNVQKYDLKFIISLLNSHLMSWFFHIYFYNKSQITLHFGNEYVRNFPIPKEIDKNQEKEIIKLVDQMLLLQKRSHEEKASGNEKERLEQQIKNIDYEIDQEVYKLYGITKEEQKIIEEGMK